jgi:hypothetical protein
MLSDDEKRQGLMGTLRCRMVEMGALSKERVEGFFIFVVDKDSPSSGISGHRVVKIVDASVRPASDGGMPRAMLGVVVGEEPVRTVAVEDVSNEKPDCKEVGQWVSAGGFIDLDGVEELKARRARLLS